MRSAQNFSEAVQVYRYVNVFTFVCVHVQELCVSE